MCTRAGCSTDSPLMQLSCVIAFGVKKPTRVVGATWYVLPMLAKGQFDTLPHRCGLWWGLAKLHRCNFALASADFCQSKPTRVAGVKTDTVAVMENGTRAILQIRSGCAFAGARSRRAFLLLPALRCHGKRPDFSSSCLTR